MEANGGSMSVDFKLSAGSIVAGKPFRIEWRGKLTLGTLITPAGQATMIIATETEEMRVIWPEPPVTSTSATTPPPSQPA